MLMLETEAPVTTIRLMVQDAMDELAAHTVDCGQCWTGAMLVRRAMRVRAERDRLDARPRLV